jgi:hypothetical protein
MRGHPVRISHDKNMKRGDAATNAKGMASRMTPSPLREPSAGATAAEGLQDLNDAAAGMWQLRLITVVDKTLFRKRKRGRDAAASRRRKGAKEEEWSARFPCRKR